jgi:hypothetical protein
MKMIKVLVFLSIFLVVVPAAAENFSGGWSMNANGWTFDLYIEQRGNEITGRMIPTNSSNPTSKISGSVNGRKINFIRINAKQEYEGYLFERDRGTMAGRFSHQGQMIYGWYARRQ